MIINSGSSYLPPIDLPKNVSICFVAPEPDVADLGESRSRRM